MCKEDRATHYDDDDSLPFRSVGLQSVQEPSLLREGEVAPTISQSLQQVRRAQGPGARRVHADEPTSEAIEPGPSGGGVRPHGLNDLKAGGSFREKEGWGDNRNTAREREGERARQVGWAGGYTVNSGTRGVETTHHLSSLLPWSQNHERAL